MKGRDYVEHLEVNGRIISERILGKWSGGADWMRLAQDRDQWRALVNTIRNLRLP
jgi:hypothetical protein